MSTALASSQPAVAVVPAGSWEVDPSRSSVEFQVEHMMIATVKGRFTGFEGALAVGEDGILSVYGIVQVASVDTNESKRDEHLRSPDFFDAASHPRITFVSTAIVPAGDAGLRITGFLTIRGVTRTVELSCEVGGVATDPWGNERVALDAHGEIGPEDFGLTGNHAPEAGDVVVPRRVKIEIALSAVRVSGPDGRLLRRRDEPGALRALSETLEGSPNHRDRRLTGCKCC